MKKFIYPDFNNCVVNVSATLAEFLGAPNTNPTLEVLKNELKKDYKNVVFMCFDGLGTYPLQCNLPKTSFLRAHVKQELVSVFPSTTTNATSALATNKYPLELGWFGWVLHFPEIKRNLVLFTGRDSLTGEQVDYKMPLDDNTDYYFDNASCTDYNVNTVLMKVCKVKHPERNTPIENDEQLFSAVREIIKRKGKQFVYTYYYNPDAAMHDYGVKSKQAKDVIEKINDECEKLYSESDNTLFIITADHGQTDVTGYIEFYKDKELNSLLECVPFLEARAPAFIVKKGKKRLFEKLFKQKYSKDFVLYKTKYLIERGFFGKNGDKGYLLGDYIAIGTYTNKLFLSQENMARFKGHHTSLTAEMTVPLILAGKTNE